MVREIKFRAWDCGEMIFTGSCWAPGVIKPHYTVTVTNEHIMWISQCKNGKYVEVDEGGKTTRYYSEWDDYHFYHPEQIMQYTGLKDKNGVEIYEGDVVECEYHSDLITTKDQPLIWRGYVVFGSDASFHVIRKGTHNGCYAVRYGGSAVKRWEVIGNIYEHSHLLDSDENPELLEDRP